MFKLKKIISVCLVTALVLCSGVAVNAATGGVKIVVDGKALSTEGVIVNGRALAPVRAISEAMGAAVEWNQQEKKIVISKLYWDSMGVKPEPDVRKVYMWIGKNKGTVSGFEFEMDVPPQIISGSTMIPVKAFGDALEAKVEWNQQTKTVTITSTLASSGQDAKHDAIKMENDLRKTTENYLNEVNRNGVQETPKTVYEIYGVGTGTNWDDTISIFFSNDTDEALPAKDFYVEVTRISTKEVLEKIVFTVGELQPNEEREYRMDDPTIKYATPRKIKHHETYPDGSEFIVYEGDTTRFQEITFDVYVSE